MVVVVIVVNQALVTLYCMQMRYVNCYVDYGQSTGENKDEGDVNQWQSITF